MKCGKPATFRVRIETGEFHRCEEHGRQMQLAADVLGCVAVIDPYIGQESCGQELEVGHPCGHF